MASWRCAACGGELPSRARVGRGDGCPHCAAELRACRQCAFYEPGIYNDCREPQAERVLDKERANFCDYFQPVGQGATVPPQRGAEDTRARLDALFRKK